MARTAEKGTPLEPQVKSVEVEMTAPAGPSKPNLAQMKQQVAKLLMDGGFSAQQIITIGQMAERSITDPALFQVFKQQIVANDMADEEDLSPQNKFRFLAGMATLGKMAEQMLRSGELRG